MKKAFTFIFLLFLVLIYHNEVIIGVKSGLLLWYQTLIPALLPFIIITNALSETHSYDVFAIKFHRIPFDIYVFIAILLGKLCGYPIGAKIINDFSIRGNISYRKANSILAVSSQASPMFLLGFVYPMLPKGIIPVRIFFLLIYVPTIIMSIFILLYNNESGSKTVNNITTGNNLNPSESFLQAVRIMVIIGIYVMIFSILLSILIPRSSSVHFKCALSFLEITTGLKLLCSLPLSTKTQICLIMSLSSFGGLSSAFQIMGVLLYNNNSIKKYLRDKIILSAGTLLLTLIYLWVRSFSPL